MVTDMETNITEDRALHSAMPLKPDLHLDLATMLANKFILFLKKKASFSCGTFEHKYLEI
jgi:hypothetical protein